MKHILILAAVTACLTGTLHAAEETKHDHKPVAGPQGGRVLEVEGGHAEFLVRPDRRIGVTFYDDAMRPQSPGTREVGAVAEAKSGKAVLEFEKTAEGFVSKAPLPEGDGYRIVLQIRPAPEAKPRNFRIDYHAALCTGCKLAEYACICADHGGGESGHGH